MSRITTRKDRHIDAVLSGEVAARSVTTGFEAVRFEHCALPELDYDAIDLSTRFLGKRLAAPLLISSMTGGPSRAEAINAALAEAAQTLGLSLGVGSQRVALSEGGAGGIDAGLRRRAPDILLFANLGAAQLLEDFSLDEVRRAVEMIGADALILHLNPLQEALQAGGDTRWAGLSAKIEATCAGLGAPVVVKEVGFGISGTVARRLADLGVAAIDVAGAGGTSWAAVEGAISADTALSARAEIFRDWGVPTARALEDVRAALPGMALIASGGVRDGLDAAKAIRLGADLVGQAGGVLKAATKGPEAVIAHFEAVIETLRTACFATGSGDLAALRTARLIKAPIED